jgi:DNA-binding MarR family transcriptional regulator
VKLLGVGGAEPECNAFSWLGDRVEVGSWQRLAHRERNRVGIEDDGVRRPGLGSRQPQLLFVERRRAFQVAHLQGNEIGPNSGHVIASSLCQYIDMNKVCQNIDMSQDDAGINLDTSLGYLLKQTHSVLRSAMDGALRPLGVTVPQYACLELLAQRPGLSNSDLARGAFVSRQSMNVLLQSLERDGLVVRPQQPSTGRVLPVQLTPLGRERLQAASAAVSSVETQMRRGLNTSQQRELRDLLASCVRSLSGS